MNELLDFLKQVTPYLSDFIAATILPFIVAYLSKIQWKAEHKLAVSFLASLIAALISSFAEGKLDGANIGQSFVIVFTAAQGVYAVFFKAMGLEKLLIPENAVVDHATNLVKHELSDLTREDALRILDSKYPDSVAISIDRDSRTP